MSFEAGEAQAVLRLLEACPAAFDESALAEVVHRTEWLTRLGIEPARLTALDHVTTEIRDGQP